MKIGVIHQGAGNIHSVCRGIRAIGHDPVIIQDGTEIAEFERLVLPGVGAFETGMRVLNQQNMIQPIHAYIATGRPFLGICLGAQLIMDSSTEFGFHEGLGLIPGTVKEIQGGATYRVPHVGWARLEPATDWTTSCLRDIASGDYMYFTHSFVCHPENPANILATVMYGNQTLVAAVRKDNVTGMQFHPELSTERGLSILQQFVDA